MQNKVEKKSNIEYIVLFVILIALMILVGFNIYMDASKFLEISAFQAISIAITIVIAYYLVQYKNDERKQKEQLDRIIDKIQHFLIELSTDISEKERSTILSLNRQVKRRIDLMNKYSKKMNIESEVSYILDRNDEIRENIDEEIDNLASVNWSNVNKNIKDIDYKLDEIRMKLYS